MIDTLNENINFIPCKLSRNELNHVIEAADPAMTSRVGLKYFLEILVPEVEGSGTFVSLHESELREKPPYTLSGVLFLEGAAVIYNRRGGKIDNLLKTKKPDPQLKTAMVVTTQTKQIKLKESITGGTPAVNVENSLPSFWVAKAGLSDEDFLSYGDIYFSSFQKESRRFLTNQPVEKMIGSNQTDYLSFLLNINPMPTLVRLRVERCFKSKKNKITSTVLTATEPSFMSVVMFPVNYSDLALDCDYFNVWLADENNARLSEVRTYFVDKKYHAQERHIFYSNSLGGWDCLRLLGEGTETVKVSQAYLKSEKSAFNILEENQMRVLSSEADRELSVSTGYFKVMPKELLANIEELLHTEAIYIVTEKGHQQLKRLTNAIVTDEDDAGNIARMLQFQYVTKAVNYSNLPAKAATPAMPTGWLPFGNQKHILNAYGKRTGYKTTESLIKIYLDDNSKVKPLQIVANVPGVEGYIESYLDNTVVVGSTPHPNTIVQKVATLAKECVAGYEGTKPTITIAAGIYGGEQVGDAQALAMAAADAQDTQAYSNANGLCNLIGPNYTANVPVNHWMYRTNNPANVSIRFKDDGTGPYAAGNDIEVQGMAGQYIYAIGTNGITFPVSGPPTNFGWKVQLRGLAPGVNRTLKFYKNGVLKYSKVITPDATGALYNYAFLKDDLSVGTSPESGDRMFWELV